MRKIYLVDTFSSKPYTGNPAPVMICENFPDNMQKIASELNFPSTAFVTTSTNGRFHIRWFSPKVELKLCGHALLAAAFVLFQDKIIAENKISFDSLSGPLEVSKCGDKLVLDFPLQRVSKINNVSLFKEILNLSDVCEVYQAQDDIIIVLESEQALHNLVLDFSAINTIEATAVIFTAPGNEYDFVSRVFAPRVGINEDPATGSSHCKLADYWSKRLIKNELRAYQASERGGHIDVQINDDRVLLKGTAIRIMEGYWYE